MMRVRVQVSAMMQGNFVPGSNRPIKPSMLLDLLAAQWVAKWEAAINKPNPAKARVDVKVDVRKLGLKLFSVKAPEVTEKGMVFNAVPKRTRVCKRPARRTPRLPEPRGVTPNRPRPGLPAPLGLPVSLACCQLNSVTPPALCCVSGGTKNDPSIRGKKYQRYRNGSGNHNGKLKPHTFERADRAKVRAMKTMAAYA